MIGFWPKVPVVFTALVLQGLTGGFVGPAIAAISLGLVGHVALAERLGRNQRFASAGGGMATALMGAIRSWSTSTPIVTWSKRPSSKTSLRKYEQSSRLFGLN